MTNGEGNIVDLGPRIAAVIVDTIIIWVILFILLIPLGISIMGRGGFGFFGGAPYILGALLIPFLYFMFFEAYMNGQTPGKMMVSIKVVKVTGEPIGIVESFIRNILRIIDQLPFLYLLGLILVAVTDKNQRLGDMVANTIVVKAK